MVSLKDYKKVSSIYIVEWSFSRIIEGIYGTHSLSKENL